MSENRPAHFPPGTPIGDHYSVEGLVRLSEGRMFYLATDVRPDRKTRKCWECGDLETARTEKQCRSCGAPLKDRRFLVSSRWESTSFDPYEALFAKGLQHPGLVAPIDLIRLPDQLLSIVPYAGEGLMIDEASPLGNQRILDVAQRIAGTLAFLHTNGVRLKWLNRANLLIAPDNTVRLYDLEVEAVAPDAITNGLRGGELASIGDMLRRYCDVEAEALAQFLETVEGGNYPTPAAFGRAVEQRFDAFAAINYKPLIGAMSDVGLTRQLNEDNWGWRKLSPRATLYVVADGMGGHDGGEVASALAVQTICRVAREREAAVAPGHDAVENLLDEAFQTANNTIKEQAEEKGTDMGTTLVAVLLLDGNLAFLANVGDSRCYRIRGQHLQQLSRDHSLVAKMVERGRITAEEARHHPHSNILLRTVGTERDVDIDISRIELESGDRLLMCTDGLWGEVEDRDIEAILNTYQDPRVAARELVRAAHHGGGKDNVTLLLFTVA
jgi:serine/threonine protein phosphatase PrpC